MNENLAALEEVIEAYRQRGFMITQQNEMSMTLVKPKSR
jgi:acetolactate synthase regulatory subunit